MIALAAETAEVERVALRTHNAAPRISALGAESIAGTHLRAAIGAARRGRTAAFRAYGGALRHFGAATHTTAGPALWRAAFLAESRTGRQRSATVMTT